MKRLLSWSLFAAAAFFCACTSVAVLEKDGMYSMDGAKAGIAGEISEAEPSGGNGIQPSSGVVTAGEWKDLDHWPFWSGLMTGEFKDKSERWGFWTNHRVAVRVVDGQGNPIQGAKVELLGNGSGSANAKPLWTAVTDHDGRADCWPDLFQKGDLKPSGYPVRINGKIMEEKALASGWDVQGEPTVTTFVAAAEPLEPSADIAFIVDATGSMGDEINFLKQDLQDILEKATQLSSTVKYRTAALFYRDEGDEYVTRPFDFTTDFAKLSTFIGNQRAGGGGDYEEAVHTALEQSLQDLHWNPSAKARIAFLLLDAPAHPGNEIAASLHRSVEQYARMGIRMIPIAASGIDKNAEFMCRFFAVVTGGTYVFITNDSGVGNDHIVASVGDYKVEKLNELLLRLLQEYAS